MRRRRPKRSSRGSLKQSSNLRQQQVVEENRKAVVVPVGTSFWEPQDVVLGFGDDDLLASSNQDLQHVEEFRYLIVLFTSEGMMEHETDGRIGAASAVMQSVRSSRFTECLGILPEELEKVSAERKVWASLHRVLSPATQFLIEREKMRRDRIILISYPSNFRVTTAHDTY
ncbi:hypothetical protein D4764_08G0000980 [Takifugu flavidus]|uniref:Uncharacterized protein n=1 Tax=Takifugu flavidus TaxID=433684 RepID=A0A5C6MPH1_9TELE|nr:hypothetical protein D4764_08G0000980 [Takifugu flavidus]